MDNPNNNLNPFDPGLLNITASPPCPPPGVVLVILISFFFYNNCIYLFSIMLFFNMVQYITWNYVKT